MNIAKLEEILDNIEKTNNNGREKHFKTLYNNAVICNNTRRYQPLYDSYMNRRFNSFSELRQAKENIKKNPTLNKLENEWVKRYLQPIISFMGTDDTIKYILSSELRVPESAIIIHHGDLRSTKVSENVKNLYFVSAPRMKNGKGEGHYRSRLPDATWNARYHRTRTTVNPNYQGTNSIFDAYDHYQIQGSNQFCQTYMMMYLIPRCRVSFQRSKLNPRDFKKFYTYTQNAIKFIESCLTKYYGESEYMTYLRKCIQMLKRHPNMCLNCADDQYESNKF